MTHYKLQSSHWPETTKGLGSLEPQPHLCPAQGHIHTAPSSLAQAQRPSTRDLPDPLNPLPPPERSVTIPTAQNSPQTAATARVQLTPPLSSTPTLPGALRRPLTPSHPCTWPTSSTKALATISTCSLCLARCRPTRTSSALTAPEQCWAPGGPQQPQISPGGYRGVPSGN